jgi:Concanavalin A-like lectin/glucanases superfamily
VSRPRRFLVVAVGLALLVALSVGVASLAMANPVPMKQGPVASYSFDEGTGETVEDLTGDGHTATIHGAEWTTHGRYGGAMEFHGGEGEYLSVPDSPELDFTEEFTLEAWVRPSTVENFYAPVVDKLAGGGGHTTSFSYGLYAGNWEHHPFGEVENPLGSGRSVTAPDAIDARTWTHLALTFDGGKERLYIDGELVDETTADPPVTTEGELEIGAETEHGDHLEGRIDEVRIYERALSGAEVGLDMETPLQTPRSGPVADWSFDEGSGTTAADDTGNGHTMTLNKATWAGGRYGNALRFDGKKGCASAAGSSELDFTEEFTLEAWVRPEGGGLHSIIAQEDEAAAGGKDPFAYTLLSGDEEEEGPRIWVRESEGGRADAGGPPIPQHAWSHLAVSDDGAHLRFYVDGELTQTEPAPPLTTGAGPLSIGCIALYGDHFKGRIDEVRAYDRVLNTGEVDADMEAPIVTPKTGPVAAYSFDEGEAGGTVVQDITGDGHTATIHGAKWSTHGVFGGALEFDAEDEDFVSIPASGALDGTEGLTVEAWVRPTESPAWGSILMKGRESGGPLYTYALYQHGEHAAGHFEESEEGVLESSEGSLPQGAWTHLAITDDGAWSRLYVNGELVDTEPALPLEGHGEIRIGGNEWWGEYFDGRIDEVRIYDRALNGGEVATDVDTPLQTPETGPVAEYSFDAGTGSTLEDRSGHANNGTIENATWTPHGRYGSALEFNGSTSCVQVPNSESLQLGEEFTLAAWVRPEGPLTEDPIFFKENDPELGFWEIPSYWMDIGFNATGKPQGYTEGAMVTGPNSIHDGVWTHVAFTYDGHALHVYVNGELQSSNPIGGLAMSSKGPLYIGCAGAYEEFFQGRIDEARIYERALTWGEVKASAEIPIQTPRQGPIAAYPFDEGEGSTAADVTGNGHEATLEGPIWTKGRYGDALDFNGPTEKCAKVPDSPTLQLREDFTIEAWVKPEGSPEEDPIIWKETGSAASYTLALGLTGGNKAEAYIGEEEGATYERVVSPSNVEPYVWTHVAATYDGVHLRLYVNGELVASKYTTTPNMASSGPLYIGCAPESEDWFAGRIDEVAILDRALTPAEAADIVPPNFGSFYAFAEQEEERAVIFFAPATDPGGATTEPPTYSYRYSINGGSFTAWQASRATYFMIPPVTEPETLRLQVAARDASGNYSPPAEETLELSEPGSPYEPSPGLLEEVEMEAESGESTAEYSKGEESEEPESSLTFAPAVAGTTPTRRPLSNECGVYVQNPHVSEHEKTKGNIVIAAASYAACGDFGAIGWVASHLMRVGRYGTYEVASSGHEPMLKPGAQEKRFVVAALDCVPGRYYTIGTAFIPKTARLIFPKPYIRTVGPTVDIEHCPKP